MINLTKETIKDVMLNEELESHVNRYNKGESQKGKSIKNKVPYEINNEIKCLFHQKIRINKNSFWGKQRINTKFINESKVY